MLKHSKQYVTDCEGPISLNDNAMELAAEFIPNGEALFTKISRYDDYLADIVAKRGYKAGDTLRLIMPFFKAYGLTEKKMREFSRNHVLLVPGAAQALADIREKMDVFIISTSYSSYVEALCDKIDFPFEFAYSTKTNVDMYELPAGEEAAIKRIKERIDVLPDFVLPPDVSSYEDLPADAAAAISEMDRIFWEDIPAMQAVVQTMSINPVGGVEKALSLEDSLMRTGNSIDNTIYVGDSITDVQAFGAVRAGGGLAVSFNGNRYAIDSADVAVYGENAKILELIAEAFLDGGKEASFMMLRELNRNIMNDINLREAHILEGADKGVIIEESEGVRRRIRGKAGDLG